MGETHLRPIKLGSLGPRTQASLISKISLGNSGKVLGEMMSFRSHVDG